MRVALHTRLKPGAEAEYDRAHAELRGELPAAIRAAGVQGWTIWRSGLELFHVIDCDDYAAMLDELADLPVNVAWQERIGALLAVRHEYGPGGDAQTLPVVWSL